MNRLSDLGDFLRTRRAQLRPEQLDLVDYGGRRRVPGLRREELAQLAGISVSYYIRLEQGHDVNASDSVLDALASALRLTPEEHTHLYSLTRAEPRPRARATPERVRESIRVVVDSLEHLPALVLGRFGDVLVWNRLAHSLLAGHLPFDSVRRAADRPNWPRMLFLDPQVRELFCDWEAKSRDTVADLRMIAGSHADAARLAELVGELSRKSSEFRALWSAHSVQRCAFHDRRFHHPVVGELTLTDELMTLPDDDGQRLILFHARPGSSSAAALTLLAELSMKGVERLPPQEADHR
ncbi:helix-turn-helix domain-containing protein [Actinoalloteichus fjordicus]|uniref:DNA binding protein with helix-turn-helix domain n=1 Tax=Actinoalloteichus fjordicus TaxID=1612552 RepID=A0AAC9LER5_9PSEU|nr:helix-turn-helix transcriptional regulator [Actinoalloteichus fjordicus]APU15407.1 DNA binding protein with helix-turn-helix domain [Actinoalloteichus fjordicus]